MRSPLAHPRNSAPPEAPVVLVPGPRRALRHPREFGTLPATVIASRWQAAAPTYPAVVAYLHRVLFEERSSMACHQNSGSSANRNLRAPVNASPSKFLFACKPRISPRLQDIVKDTA